MKAVAELCTCNGRMCGLEPLPCSDSWRPLSPGLYTLPQIFRCATCRRDVPACNGAADDMPNDCDDCWNNAHSKGRERAA